jgi:hypothetical protein
LYREERTDMRTRPAIWVWHQGAGIREFLLT